MGGLHKNFILFDHGPWPRSCRHSANTPQVQIQFSKNGSGTTQKKRPARSGPILRCLSSSVDPSAFSAQQQEMEFEKRKAVAMAALAAPAPDKSPKGAVDAPIVPLLDAINRHPSYFTTSSCSGRISILVHGCRSSPVAESMEGDRKKAYSKKKAGGGTWILVSHDPADPDAVVDLLFGAREKDVEGNLVFRFEPLIVAVECRDVPAAQALVSTAISCGFRESGE